MQPGLRVHHIATGSIQVSLVITNVGSNKSLAVQAWQIKIFKGCDRATHLVHIEACQSCPFDGKIDQVSFLKNIPDQLAVFQVIGRKRSFILLKLAFNFFRFEHRVLFFAAFDQFAAAE